MEYSASIEWICDHSGVLRLHPSPAGVVGDPFVWSIFVVKEGNLAILKGAIEAPPHEGTTAITTALKESGFTSRGHERIKDGTIKIIKKRL